MRMAEEVVMGDVPAIGSGHLEADEIAHAHPIDCHISREHVLRRAQLAGERDVRVDEFRPLPGMGPRISRNDSEGMIVRP